MEFHIAGIVYSIVKPHSVEIQDKRVVEVPGQISVVEDRSDRTRTVEFSTRDEQKFKVISSIHQGDHVTIDGEIFENEQHLLFIRVDGSGGTRGNPTVSPESTVSR